MPGTKLGGQAARDTNKARYGENYYQVIGALGGKWDNPSQRPFAKNRDLARAAGAKGGRKSKRGEK